MSDDLCLDAASPHGPVKIVRCHGMGGNQAWVYNEEVMFDLCQTHVIRESLFVARSFLFSSNNVLMKKYHHLLSCLFSFCKSCYSSYDILLYCEVRLHAFNNVLAKLN